MTLFGSLALLIILKAVLSESVVYPPSRSYNYNYTRTFEITKFIDDNNMYQEIALPFPIMFQNTQYTKLYVSSNSYITFGEGYANYTLFQFLPSPKILIQARDYRITLLKTFETDTNFTIRYEGKLANAYKFRPIRWYVTFYKVSHQKFDIHIQTGDFKNGESFLCTSLNCYQPLDTKSLVTYIQCLPHSCYQVNSRDCQYIMLPSCQQCSGTIPLSASSCQKCTTPFQISNSTCSSCSDNYTHWNNTCVEVSSRCVDVDGSQPSVCSKCEPGFTGSMCAECEAGYYADGYKCRKCNFDGCEICNKQGCLRCKSGYTKSGIWRGECEEDQESQESQSSSTNIGAIIAGCGVAISAICVGVAVWRCIVCIKQRRNSRVVSDTHEEQQIHTEKPDDGSKDLMCSICLEESCTMMTQCNHPFHRKCLFMWTKKDIHCPNCKRSIERTFKFCKHCKRFNIQVPIRPSIDQVHYCVDCQKLPHLVDSEQSFLPVCK